MDVETLGTSDGQFRVIVRDIEPTLMNAIRRSIMTEIPIPAIEKVYIAENTGVLYDDMLAHRLGLVPLKGGETLNFPEECECRGKGCPKCEAILDLEVEATEDRFSVLSGRLKAEGSVFPANNGVPLVQLNTGQRVKLEAHARLGTGKQHAKWQPVSVSVIKYEPIIEIDAEKCDLCAKCVEACPKKVLSVKGKSITISSSWSCTPCSECANSCPAGAVKVTYNDRNVMLMLESQGSMTNEELVLAACDILTNKFTALRNAIKELPEAS